MFEKVNPCHPDKIADRIAGAIVDYAYICKDDPKIAVEVLFGHNYCFAIIETDIMHGDLSLNKGFDVSELENIIKDAVSRAGVYTDDLSINILIQRQDEQLSKNQDYGFRCGDNGIFKGIPITEEEQKLTTIAKNIFEKYPTDGKYILDKEKLIICQSYSDEKLNESYPQALINPLGNWKGGFMVDTGAVNRKLGSDMGNSVTGGGLHGKDLSKADVSVNIYAFLKAQQLGQPVEISCAIGDDTVDGKPYREIVEIARHYIAEIGGFEKFAEWGLIR